MAVANIVPYTGGAGGPGQAGGQLQAVHTAIAKFVAEIARVAAASFTKELARQVQRLRVGGGRGGLVPVIATGGGGGALAPFGGGPVPVSPLPGGGAGGGKAPSASDIGQAVVAIGLVVDALKAIPNVVRGWVEAFNPGAVEQLSWAWRDLSATLGYAFEPVIQGLTIGLREFAGAIRAGMDALRPAIMRVVQVILQVLHPWFAALGSGLQGVASILNGTFQPILKLVATGLEGLATLLSVAGQLFNTVGMALVEAVAGLFGLDGVTDLLREAMGQLVRAFMTGANVILRLVDSLLGSSLSARFLTALGRDTKNDRRAAAPLNVSVGGFEDIYRRRLTEAARAGGGASPLERQTSILDEIRGHAREMLEAQRRGVTLGEEFREAWAGFPAAALQLARETYNVLAAPVRWAGGLLGGPRRPTGREEK
jgi:hypothetical protein